MDLTSHGEACAEKPPTAGPLQLEAQFRPGTPPPLSARQTPGPRVRARYERPALDRSRSLREHILGARRSLAHHRDCGLNEIPRPAPGSIGQGKQGSSKRSFRPIIDNGYAPRADGDLDTPGAHLGGDLVLEMADSPPFLSEWNGHAGPFDAAGFDEEVAPALEWDGIGNGVPQIVDYVVPGHDRGLPFRGASERSRSGEDGLWSAFEGRTRLTWYAHVGIPLGSLEPERLATVRTLDSIDENARPSPGSDETAVDSQCRRLSLGARTSITAPARGCRSVRRHARCGRRRRPVAFPAARAVAGRTATRNEKAHSGEVRPPSITPVRSDGNMTASRTRGAFRSVDVRIASS
jgi:hypothetical protein